MQEVERNAEQQSDRDAFLKAIADEAFNEVIEDLRKTMNKNSIKAYTVEGKYLPKELKEFKDEVVIIDRSKDGKSGQGSDMCQEEFLKKGLN